MFCLPFFALHAPRGVSIHDTPRSKRDAGAPCMSTAHSAVAGACSPPTLCKLIEDHDALSAFVWGRARLDGSASKLLEVKPNLEARQLLDPFVAAWRQDPSMRLGLAFHGTLDTNVANICTQGFRLGFACGRAYVGSTLSKALTYALRGNIGERFGQVLVCAVLVKLERDVQPNYHHGDFAAEPTRDELLGCVCEPLPREPSTIAVDAKGLLLPLAVLTVKAEEARRRTYFELRDRARDAAVKAAAQHERDAAVKATARHEAALRRSASDARVRHQEPSPSVMPRPPPPLPTGKSNCETPSIEAKASDQANKQHRSRPVTALDRRANLSRRKASERHEPPPPPLPTGESDTKTPSTEVQAVTALERRANRSCRKASERHEPADRESLPPLPTGESDNKTSSTETQASDQAKQRHRARLMSELERRANLSRRKASERHASENRVESFEFDKESRHRSSETLAMHNALAAVLNREHKWPFARPLWMSAPTDGGLIDSVSYRHRN